LLRTPRYAALAASLASDGRLSGKQRAGAVAAFGYALLPVDLLPGFIPVVGQLDDLAVMIGGLRAVLRGVAPEVQTEHLERAGLSLATLDADLAAVRDTAWWLGRSGARLIGRAVGTAERLARSAAQSLGRGP
jgi:uncharacterized membrane protein YkvA (DUF1232 family)